MNVRIDISDRDFYLATQILDDANIPYEEGHNCIYVYDEGQFEVERILLSKGVSAWLW